MKRSTIFLVQIAWLIGLGALAVIYFLQQWPSKLISLGPIPIGVVWFGALGAVLISLTGVVEHADDWDEKLYLWHLSRPLMGAALGVVGVLILQAGVLAAGTQPTVGIPGTPKNLLYFLVAFLVGYREETFRELIKRLVDLIFAPGPAPPPKPTIASLNPNTGPVLGGGSVKILGSGFVGTLAVTFGSASAKFNVDSDGQISADLPSSAAPGPVTVTVKTKGGSATASFTYVTQ
jgi:hypothetical protein